MNNQAFFLLGLGLAMVALAESSDFYKANVPETYEEIIFNSTDFMVDPGDVVHLNCGIKGHTAENWICVWTNNNISYQVLDVYQGVYSSKGKPENTEDNQCGIILKSIQNEDNGLWKCSIYLTGKNLIDTKMVTVTVKPAQIDIRSDGIANADDPKNIECTVGKARPKAEITWTLNGIDITDQAKSNSEENFETEHKTIWVEKEETEDNKRTGEADNKKKDTSKDEILVPKNITLKVPTGHYKTISTLTHKFTQNENNAKLKCIVDHPTLKTPKIEEIPITVGIAATKLDEQNFYNINETSNHTIKFSYTAFPKPNSNKWKFGQTTHGANDTKDGKFIASLYEIANATYEAELRLFNLSEIEGDYGKYEFEVANSIGKTVYKFNISMHGVPIGGGSSVTSVWFLYTVLSILALFL